MYVIQQLTLNWKLHRTGNWLTSTICNYQGAARLDLYSSHTTVTLQNVNKSYHTAAMFNMISYTEQGIFPTLYRLNSLLETQESSTPSNQSHGWVRSHSRNCWFDSDWDYLGGSCRFLISLLGWIFCINTALQQQLKKAWRAVQLIIFKSWWCSLDHL